MSELSSAQDTGLVFSHRYLQHHPGFQPIWALSSESSPFVDFDQYPSNHRLVMRTQQLIDLSGLTPSLLEVAPKMATEEDLLTYHTEEYVRKVRSMAITGGETGQGALMGPGSWDIAMLSVGGVMTAVDLVMQGTTKRAFANVRPPGHHAMSDLGMGFCIFGNVALAANYARKTYGLSRILILDWDVHHGNGTQDAFYGDPEVLFISLHQEDHYPAGSGAIEDTGSGSGEGYTVNLPLPAGSGHAAYLAAFDRVVLPIIDSFRPELIIVSAGQDASNMDPLGRMCLTTESYRWMTSALMAAADRTAEGRIVIAQEGGYSEAYAPYCTFAIVETLAGVETGLAEPVMQTGLLSRVPGRVVNAAAEATLEEIGRVQGAYWPVLAGMVTA